MPRTLQRRADLQDRGGGRGALGYLVRFKLLPGRAHDLRACDDLLEGLDCGMLIGDRAFCADWLLDDLKKRRTAAVIPPKRNCKAKREFDRHEYNWRHLIENFFSKIKEFRGIAMRFDKTDVRFAAKIYLASALIAAR